jgi:hypothetical protein
VKLEKIQEYEVHNGSSTLSRSPPRCHIVAQDSEPSTGDPPWSVMAKEPIVAPPSATYEDIQCPPPISPTTQALTGVAKTMDANPIA